MDRQNRTNVACCIVGAWLRGQQQKLGSNWIIRPSCHQSLIGGHLKPIIITVIGNHSLRPVSGTILWHWNVQTEEPKSNLQQTNQQIGIKTNKTGKTNWIGHGKVNKFHISFAFLSCFELKREDHIDGLGGGGDDVGMHRANSIRNQ